MTLVEWKLDVATRKRQGERHHEIVTGCPRQRSSFFSFFSSPLIPTKIIDPSSKFDKTHSSYNGFSAFQIHVLVIRGSHKNIQARVSIRHLVIDSNVVQGVEGREPHSR